MNAVVPYDSDTTLKIRDRSAIPHSGIGPEQSIPFFNQKR